MSGISYQHVKQQNKTMTVLKIIAIVFVVLLLFAGVAFIGVVAAIMIITSGNRSIVIDAEIKEDKEEKEENDLDHHPEL